MDKKYRIRDMQFDCRYYAEGAIFTSKKDIFEHLAEYHDIDYDRTEPESLTNHIKKLCKTTQERLDWILEYGEWELEEISVWRLANKGKRG